MKIMMKSGRWILVGSLVSVLIMGGLGLAMGKKENGGATTKTNIQTETKAVEKPDAPQGTVSERIGETKPTAGKEIPEKKLNLSDEVSDTAARILRQKRVEIFKEMGWVEGKYANEKERQLVEKFKVDMSPKRKTLLIEEELMMSVRNKEHRPARYWIRPLVEIIFNPELLPTDRVVMEFAVFHLGLIRDPEKIIPILRKLLDDSDIEVRKAAIQGLYFCGNKKIAFLDS
ncbi:MAG: HEAT repeat domain-containing protein [bacterium]|nr:HEAT repeat domain-containing protein [bacterium]